MFLLDEIKYHYSREILRCYDDNNNNNNNNI